MRTKGTVCKLEEHLMQGAARHFLGGVRAKAVQEVQSGKNRCNTVYKVRHDRELLEVKELVNLRCVDDVYIHIRQPMQNMKRMFKAMSECYPGNMPFNSSVRKI